MLLINLFRIVRKASFLVNLRLFYHNSTYGFGAQYSIHVSAEMTYQGPALFLEEPCGFRLCLTPAFDLGDSLYRGAQE